MDDDWGYPNDSGKKPEVNMKGINFFFVRTMPPKRASTRDEARPLPEVPRIWIRRSETMDLAPKLFQTISIYKCYIKLYHAIFQTFSNYSAISKLCPFARLYRAMSFCPVFTCLLLVMSNISLTSGRLSSPAKNQVRRRGT